MVNPTPVKPTAHKHQKINDFGSGRVVLTARHLEKIIPIKLPQLKLDSEKTGYKIIISNKTSRKLWVQTEPKGLPDLVLYHSSAAWANIKGLDGTDGIWIKPHQKHVLQDNYQYSGDQSSSSPKTIIDMVVRATAHPRK